MQSLLLQVQDTVQKYAEIMSRITGIDVEVMDSQLYRAAGTGIFADKVNEDMSGEGDVYRYVMRTGQVQIIDDPGKHPLCENCSQRDSCREAIEISKPIQMDEDCIGVIGLIGSSIEQKEVILKDKEMYLDLLDQIAEFIVAKVHDYQEMFRREAIISTLDSVINYLEQGVLIVGQDQIITTANKEAHRQFGGITLEGSSLSMEATGDKLNHGDEYRIQVQEKELIVYGKAHEISKPSSRYARMLIFCDGKMLLKQMYEMTHVVNQLEMDAIIGSSKSTMTLKKEITKIANGTSSVLISGESGTGKEVAATAIWKMSERKNKKFVAINCGAIPEALLEAELFGYVKGAFTGADPNGRVGKFELADQGVLFLDEIGDMPLYLQVKLLRVLQERKIVRIGSNQVIPINVRIISATNRDLKEMIAAKKFREDLYYRLNVIPLKIDPLRKRPEDIEELAYFFAARYARFFNKEFRSITMEAMLILRTYPWYGNVRELENTMEFMINMMEDDGILDNKTLPANLLFKEEKPVDIDIIHTLKELEEIEIQKALERFGNTTEGKKEAAKSLGIGLATLYRKLEQ
ncbi:MAG: sigma 54-interacting transcriptional regulator [Lachnospiraceae bacterium]|nr:sigma 54-interacting transcriptional regulator [Lachnospiraceae bacterium]